MNYNDTRSEIIYTILIDEVWLFVNVLFIIILKTINHTNDNEDSLVNLILLMIGNCAVCMLFSYLMKSNLYIINN